MRRVGALVALDVGETAAVVCPNSCHTVDLVDGSRATRLGGDVARPVSPAALSPDETHVALLEDRESTFTLLVSDVATGAVRPIATGLRRATAAGTVAWSRDGRFLFFQTGGGNLGVFDAELGTTHLVEVDVDLGLADFMVAGDAQMADTALQTEQPSTNRRRPNVR